VIGTRSSPQEVVAGLAIDGELRIVGRTTLLSASARRALTPWLAPPAGKHPWPVQVPRTALARFHATGRDVVELTLVEPIVVEVRAGVGWDGHGFRHLLRFLRVRPDAEVESTKPPSFWIRGRRFPLGGAARGPDPGLLHGTRPQRRRGLATRSTRPCRGQQTCRSTTPPTAGEFGYYATDPYTPRAERVARTDRVEALVIGAGFGGLMTAARLHEAGVTSVRMSLGLDLTGAAAGVDRRVTSSCSMTRTWSTRKGWRRLASPRRSTWCPGPRTPSSRAQARWWPRRISAGHTDGWAGGSVDRCDQCQPDAGDRDPAARRFVALFRSGGVARAVLAGTCRSRPGCTVSRSQTRWPFRPLIDPPEATPSSKDSARVARGA
jgi:hypothetical protein